MSQAQPDPANDRPGDRIPYLHGAAAREQRRLARRTAATSADFFLPHLRPGMRLLDCGCGPGSITLGLAEAVAPGEVIGIDFQAAQVQRAGALALERGTANARFEVASAYELPFADASFDAVFAHTLLLHLREPLRALREMRRVLKPGGAVGIADADHGTRLTAPEAPLFRASHDLVERAVRHHGGDPYAARHHRRRLLEAGFVRPVAGATIWAGGVWGTPEDTREFAAWWADQLQQSTFVELVTTQGWADRATLAAMVAVVMAWGERPDAFLALMGVTAVGWVEDQA